MSLLLLVVLGVIAIIVLRILKVKGVILPVSAASVAWRCGLRHIDSQ